MRREHRAIADLAVLSMMYAIGGGLHGIFQCALREECRDLKKLMRKLGSKGANYITWTAEELQNALFSTYPHQPTPVDPGLLVFSIGLSNTPILGDLYDLYTGVTGYDPINGQYLAGWERLANIAGAIPILGLSGANIRHGVHAAEALIDSGDEMAQFIGAAKRTCSFDEETPVATDEGNVPIREVDVGDRVLAWNETLGREPTGRGYYTVTDAYTDVHEVLVYLTIDGEELTTTPEHPFLQADGEWAPAGRLEVGDELRNANGESGVVEAVEFAATPQVMYNMTVADAHTYTVGDGEWMTTKALYPSRKRVISVLYLDYTTSDDRK